MRGRREGAVTVEQLAQKENEVIIGILKLRGTGASASAPVKKSARAKDTAKANA